MSKLDFAIISAGIAALLVWVWLMYVRPYLRLRQLRIAARKHVPMPREVWMQDGEFLFVEFTDRMGVSLMVIDQKSKNVSRWRDSWEAWEERLKKRTVFFTGRIQ